MAWLTENWIWILFGVAFIVMHFFGHGGHGGHGGGHCGHGGHGSSRGGDRDPGNDTAKPAKGSRAAAPDSTPRP